jgi:hypothetical protein
LQLARLTKSFVDDSAIKLRESRELNEIRIPITRAIVDVAMLLAQTHQLKELERRNPPAHVECRKPPEFC